MAAEAESMNLGSAVVLLAAGVVAVPVFRKLGLGSVLGYLAAGLVIGPFGLKLFTDPETILHVAELGVVMFLFLIGLETRPAKLWQLRKEIFGLGLTQVLICGTVLTCVALALGFPWPAAVIVASGFVLSSTAVIMKTLDERGVTATPAGQRAVSILLLEDLAVVPLLALTALLGTLHGAPVEDARPPWLGVSIALGSVAVVIAAGRWLLNPFFQILARSGAREVMTAAALLVVLGAALFMQWGGFSMAMGAFLAGVLLSESTFRHQLEADIEPFRGILLGLFFLSVGMSLNVDEVVRSWPLVVAVLPAFMLGKALVVYAVARLFKAERREAVKRAALFAQGGEFAFVLYAAATSVGLFDARTDAILIAVIILSIALSPLVVKAANSLLPPLEESMDGIELAEGLNGQVLMIGFGRFAQLVSQPLLAKGFEVSLIETDTELIRVAADAFGFKVYYGDGTRLDVLRASGAGEAEAILVCVDKPETADRIVELVKAEFPMAKLFVRAFDRGHAMRLVKAGVDYQLRELFESSLAFGQKALVALGVDEEEAAEAILEVRRRDEERLELELAGGLEAGRSLMRNNVRTPKPDPFTVPRRKGETIIPNAAGALVDAAEAPGA
jgi:glutathione-regulated potassium-efflux system protein KefB